MSGHEAVLYRGQAYHRVRREPYIRKDGSETTVSIWRSNCSVCGTEFECMSGDQAKVFKPARTCPAHRKRVKWADRVQPTDPATLPPVTWPQRAFAPTSAYDEKPPSW